MPSRWSSVPSSTKGHQNCFWRLLQGTAAPTSGSFSPQTPLWESPLACWSGPSSSPTNRPRASRPTSGPWAVRNRLQRRLQPFAQGWLRLAHGTAHRPLPRQALLRALQPGGVRRAGQQDQATLQEQSRAEKCRPSGYPKTADFFLHARSILFALCHFHSLMLERKKFGALGYNMLGSWSVGTWAAADSAWEL